LVPIITGDNAVYSRNNPGVLIAYAVKYLKDDKVAKLGYTTEYTATECSAIRTADVVTVDLIEFEAVKDCDVGPGDFDFNATVLYSGSVSSTQPGPAGSAPSWTTARPNRSTKKSYSLPSGRREIPLPSSFQHGRKIGLSEYQITTT